MEVYSPKTPTKASRPKFQRSVSAAAEFSPPQRLHGFSRPTTAQHAAKRLHLPGTHGRDHTHKHSSKHRLDAPSRKQSPSTTSGSGAVSKSKDEGKSNGVSQAPIDVAKTAAGRGAADVTRSQYVVKERHRRGRRDEELRSTLHGLSELAHDSTRQLDNMFYSIVEKVSTLQSTIRILQQLSVQSAQLHADFRAEATAVETEFCGQVDHFSDFEAQRKQVESLEQRIQRGVKKTQTLSGRLETARKRVELWERRENEWQARTSLRLRICWTCSGVALIMIVALIVIRGIYKAPFGFDGMMGSAGPQSHDDALFREMQAEFDTSVDTPPSIVGPSEQSEKDARLGVFDEL